MLSLKYSSYIFLLLFSFQGYSQVFTGAECLKADYTYDIINENYFFGLIKERLLISKNKCQLKLEYKKVLTKEWNIDVCREPIHMKIVEYGKETIYKRSKTCEAKDQTEFCQELNSLLKDVLDFGLMYAEGSREALTTKHGMTYCLSLLAKKYLAQGYVYSLSKNSPLLFEDEVPRATDSESIEVQSKVQLPSIETLAEPVDKIEDQSEVPYVEDSTDAPDEKRF